MHASSIFVNASIAKIDIKTCLLYRILNQMRHLQDHGNQPKGRYTADQPLLSQPALRDTGHVLVDSYVVLRFAANKQQPGPSPFPLPPRLAHGWGYHAYMATMSY